MRKLRNTIKKKLESIRATSTCKNNIYKVIVGTTENHYLLNRTFFRLERSRDDYKKDATTVRFLLYWAWYAGRYTADSGEDQRVNWPLPMKNETGGLLALFGLLIRFYVADITMATESWLPYFFFLNPSLYSLWIKMLSTIDPEELRRLFYKTWSFWRFEYAVTPQTIDPYIIRGIITVS